MKRAITSTGKKAPKPKAVKPGKQSAHDRGELFIRHYLIHRNASRAYVEAGYQDGPGTRQSAHRLLTSAYIQERIAEETEKAIAKAEIRIEDVLSHYKNIAFADLTGLTSYRIECCRYCWGIGHAYQWRTQREYEAALHEAIQELDKSGKEAALPSDEGGTGFTTHNPPNVECPECDGYGVPRVVFKDTRSMSASERAVFAGLEVTKYGIKYRTHDQMEALKQIAERLNFFKEANDDRAKTFAEKLDEMMTGRVSRLPIYRYEDEGD